jgi:hypothetical protein
LSAKSCPPSLARQVLPAKSCPPSLARHDACIPTRCSQRNRQRAELAPVRALRQLLRRETESLEAVKSDNARCIAGELNHRSHAQLIN